MVVNSFLRDTGVGLEWYSTTKTPFTFWKMFAFSPPFSWENLKWKQRPDLGHFKVNWPRTLKREECSSVGEFSTKDRGRVRVENSCSEPFSLKREGLHQITTSSHNWGNCSYSALTACPLNWHFTWTRSTQPSVLPLVVDVTTLHLWHLGGSEH